MEADASGGWDPPVDFGSYTYYGDCVPAYKDCLCNEHAASVQTGYCEMFTGATDLNCTTIQVGFTVVSDSLDMQVCTPAQGPCGLNSQIGRVHVQTQTVATVGPQSLICDFLG